MYFLLQQKKNYNTLFQTESNGQSTYQESIAQKRQSEYQEIFSVLASSNTVIDRRRLKVFLRVYVSLLKQF